MSDFFGRAIFGARTHLPAIADRDPEEARGILDPILQAMMPQSGMLACGAG